MRGGRGYGARRYGTRARGAGEFEVHVLQGGRTGHHPFQSGERVDGPEHLAGSRGLQHQGAALDRGPVHAGQGSGLLDTDPAHGQQQPRGRSGRGDQPVRGVEGGDPAVDEDGDAVAQRLGLVEVVGRVDDRAALALEGAQHLPQIAAGLRVEGGRRLVQEDQLRAVDEGGGDGQALALAAGEVLHEDVPLLGEPHALQRAVGGRRCAAVQARDRDEVLARALPYEEGRGLGLHAHPGQQVGVAGPGTPAEDGDRAAVGLPQSLHDLDEGRLARPVGAEQSEELAAAHVEETPSTARRSP